MPSCSATDREKDMDELEEGELQESGQLEEASPSCAMRPVSPRTKREREQLGRALKDLTRSSVSVQDALKHFERTCDNLRSAVRYLDRLASICLEGKDSSIDSHAECLAFSKAIMEGLRSVSVVSNTSVVCASGSQNADAALALFRTALKYKRSVFTPAAANEVQRMVQSSRLLKVILGGSPKPSPSPATPKQAALSKMATPTKQGEPPEQASAVAAAPAAPPRISAGEAAPEPSIDAKSAGHQSAKADMQLAPLPPPPPPAPPLPPPLPLVTAQLPPLPLPPALPPMPSALHPQPPPPPIAFPQPVPPAMPHSVPQQLPPPPSLPQVPPPPPQWIPLQQQSVPPLQQPPTMPLQQLPHSMQPQQRHAQLPMPPPMPPPPPFDAPLPAAAHAPPPPAHAAALPMHGFSHAFPGPPLTLAPLPQAFGDSRTQSESGFGSGFRQGPAHGAWAQGYAAGASGRPLVLESPAELAMLEPSAKRPRYHEGSGPVSCEYQQPYLPYHSKPPASSDQGYHTHAQSQQPSPQYSYHHYQQQQEQRPQLPVQGHRAVLQGVAFGHGAGGGAAGNGSHLVASYQPRVGAEQMQHPGSQPGENLMHAQAHMPHHEPSQDALLHIGFVNGSAGGPVAHQQALGNGSFVHQHHQAQSQSQGHWQAQAHRTSPPSGISNGQDQERGFRQGMPPKRRSTLDDAPQGSGLAALAGPLGPPGRQGVQEKPDLGVASSALLVSGSEANDRPGGAGRAAGGCVPSGQGLETGSSAPEALAGSKPNGAGVEPAVAPQAADVRPGRPVMQGSGPDSPSGADAPAGTVGTGGSPQPDAELGAVSLAPSVSGVGPEAQLSQALAAFEHCEPALAAALLPPPPAASASAASGSSGGGGVAGVTKLSSGQGQVTVARLAPRNPTPALPVSARSTPPASPPAPVSEEPAALLASSRLCLVLDLDNTLLNSVMLSEVDEATEAQLLQYKASGSGDLYRQERLGMWTKLRPGVRQFLQAAARKFELWIHTNGNRPYADAMAALLDPEGTLFGSRIIAQGEAGGGTAGTQAKRLDSGLEGRDAVAVILDDSTAVWPHDLRSLLVVERYLWFPASRQRFGLPGKSLLQVNRDECPERGMLMTASQVLDRIHATVFEQLREHGGSAAVDASAPSASDPLPSWDVRAVMSAERQKVLAGCHLVFSRVIPLEQVPSQHSLWQMAEQFGAVCSTRCSPATTHVVANSQGTDKTQWAKQQKRFLVSPAWLECSCLLWQRASEARFPVPTPGPR